MKTMLIGTLGASAAQQVFQPSGGRPLSQPSARSPFQQGLLTTPPQFETHLAFERHGPSTSQRMLGAHAVLGRSFGPSAHYAFRPLAVAPERTFRQVPYVLGERNIVIDTPPELPDLPKQEQGAQPFVLAIRDLIENTRLAAARRMLDAAPDYVLGDPLVTRLRSALAPPIVKRVARRDVDRREEYEWLRTNGRQYRGRWVALVGQDLVASAPTLHALQTQLALMRLPRAPLLHRVN